MDDREGESPSPMEPGWGGRSTARRPVVAVDTIFLRRSVPVKRFNREVTLRHVLPTPARAARGHRPVPVPVPGRQADAVPNPARNCRGRWPPPARPPTPDSAHPPDVAAVSICMTNSIHEYGRKAQGQSWGKKVTAGRVTASRCSAGPGQRLARQTWPEGGLRPRRDGGHAGSRRC